MSKYTKGPWEYNEQLGAEFSMISGDGVVVASIPNAITETDSSVVDLETNRANARLISASPELLEACKYLTEWLHAAAPLIKDIPEHLQPYPLIEKANNAIAKAEGSQ